MENAEKLDKPDKRVVVVTVMGHEYRIRTDADETALRQLAEFVDTRMRQVTARTGTVDSLDVAVLASLNLGRELLGLRQQLHRTGGRVAEEERLRGLIEFAESALVEDGSLPDTPLLTVPAGDEVDEMVDGELFGALPEETAEPPTARS